MQDKIDKLTAQKTTYTEKIKKIDEEVKALEEQLNNSRIDEITAKMTSTGLSVDEVLEAIEKAAAEKAQ